MTVEEPTEVRVQLAPLDVLCFGESTGSAKATPSGGVGPYEVVWQDGTIGTVLESLSAGQYRLSVTDANGCLTPATVTIEEPAAPLSGVASMEPPRCHGGSTGAFYSQQMEEHSLTPIPLAIGLQMAPLSKLAFLRDFTTLKFWMPTDVLS